MFSSRGDVLQAAEGVADPYGGETEEDVEADIDGRFEDGAIFKKCQRFEAECGVGGKSTQHSDKEKDTDIRSKEMPGFSQAMEEADQEASKDVDGKSADGKAQCRTEPVEHSSHHKSADGAKKASKSNPK